MKKAKIVADFESWQETLEIMSNKKLMAGIKKALQDVKAKKVYFGKKLRKKY